MSGPIEQTAGAERPAPKRAAGFWQGEAVNRLVLAASLPLFFGLWEIVSRSGVVNVILFPPPSTVLGALLDWLESGQLLIDFGLWSAS